MPLDLRIKSLTEAVRYKFNSVMTSLDAKVSSVNATAPIVSSGGTSPTLSITPATTSAAGSMSSADKTKLDGFGGGSNYGRLNGGNTWSGGQTFGAVAADTLSVNAATAQVSTPSARFYSNAGGSGSAVQPFNGLSVYNNLSGGFLDTAIVYGASVDSYLEFGHHNGTNYNYRMRLNADGTTSFSGAVTSAQGIGATSPDQNYSRLNLTNTNGQSYAIIAGDPELGQSGFSIYDATSEVVRWRMDSTGAVSMQGTFIAANVSGTNTGDQVISVSGPLTSTGGYNPTLSIRAATTSLSGSMSAADKAKLDGLSGGSGASTSTANTWTAKQTFAPSSTTVAGINLGQGSAPSSPVNGDVWTTSSGLFIYVTNTTAQAAMLPFANTWTNKNTFSASTTGRATLNISHGVAPTSPTAGDIWTTTSGLYARINTATVGPFGTVSSVSVTSANGISGSVSNGTTTPAITLSLGAITPTSVNAPSDNSGSIGTSSNRWASAYLLNLTTANISLSGTIAPASDNTGNMGTNSVRWGAGNIILFRSSNITSEGNLVGQNAYTNILQPNADNAYSLGTASSRWTQVFAVVGSINTSDREAKKDIGPIPDAWLDAWGEVNWCRFRFKDGTRWHTGLIAQEVHAAFANHGIDAFDIGLCCFDEWTDKILDDPKGDGTVEHKMLAPAGRRWGLRYDECQAMEAAWNRRKFARLQAVIDALSARPKLS